MRQRDEELGLQQGNIWPVPRTLTEAKINAKYGSGYNTMRRFLPRFDDVALNNGGHRFSLHITVFPDMLEECVE